MQLACQLAHPTKGEALLSCESVMSPSRAAKLSPQNEADPMKHDEWTLNESYVYLIDGSGIICFAKINMGVSGWVGVQGRVVRRHKKKCVVTL